MTSHSGSISIRLIAALSAAITVNLLSGDAQAREGVDVTHWVVGRTATEGVAINPVSGERKSLGKEWAAGLGWRPTRQPPAISPDGTLVAFVQEADAMPAERAAGLYVAKRGPAGEGGDERDERTLLVPAADEPRDFAWMPNGKSLICAYGAAHRTQVYRIDIDFKTNAQTRLSDVKDRAFDPQVSSNGTIAWLALRDQVRKQSFIDLMVLSKPDERPRALVERADITAFAFSPDGAGIAWSTHNQMMIIDAATGEKTGAFEFAKRIDERLYAHHAHSIAWSPDGQSLAAAIRFSGGRSAPIDGDVNDTQPIFGDREVFIIPLEAAHKASWFTLEDDCAGVDWVDKP